MRDCFEYKNHRGEGPIGTTVTPAWVENGGFLYDSDSKTYVCFSSTESNRQHHIPDNLVKLDKAGFVARGLEIHAKSPFVSPSATLENIGDLPNAPKMTTAEATAVFEAMWNENIAD